MSMMLRRTAVCCVLSLLLAMSTWSPAIAQDTSQGFTFKRVKPPAAGEKKKINISIERTWPYDDDDEDDKPATAERAIDQPAPKQDSDADWFWATVSADIEEASPTRLDEVLRVLNETNSSDRSKFAPNIANLEAIISAHGANILAATAGKRVSPALVLAVIAVESAGRPNAVSPKGAQGLMQLIPATAERFGVTDSSDPLQNISGGAAYLDWLLGQFKGDAVLSLAGYNAGENAVIKNGGVPPYAETRSYIPKVVAAWEKARTYCLTLPVHVDDGCVFAFNRSFLK